MKTSTGHRSFRFYLWVGLAFLAFWLIHDLSKYDETFTPRILNNVWRTAYVTFINWILFEYTVPYILAKRKWLINNILLGILLAFIHMLLYSFGLWEWRAFGVALHVWTPLVEFKSRAEGIENQMAYSVSSVLFFGTIRHIYNYIRLKQAAQRLRIEKQTAELNYLRSQTNPHFLFNTLNNIYSLARDKSDLAPDSILRLSKILRFMLYEAGTDFISVEKELKIITDYIALEKLRYDESLRINFNYDVEDMKQSLPPLLLMPLVENAFKHGVSETRNQPFVDIHLSIRNRQLVFQVKNSSEILADKTKISENIGLSNLRRQLELLYTDFKISLEQADSVFSANLSINLASHV